MQQNRKLTESQLAGLCEQLHLVVSSSIHITSGFESIIGGFSGEDQGALKQSLALLEENQPLSMALERCGLVPRYMLTMLEIGEASGKLDTVLQALAQYYRKQDELRRQVKNAITYPVVISFMVLLVMTVLVTRVLPIFADVFANLGGSAPDSVRVVTQISRVLVTLMAVLFGGFVLSVVAMLLRYRTPDGKEQVRLILNKIPFANRIYERLQIAQFASSISLLVSSGYDMERALAFSEEVTTDAQLKGRIQAAIAQLNEGESISTVLTQMGIFRGIHGQLVRMAAQTGQLDQVLERLSVEYTQDVEQSIERMIGIIEPTLVGATAFIIGGILLTIMLPLLGIMSSIG